VLYSLFGLRLHSNRPIPGLVGLSTLPAEICLDIDICLELMGSRRAELPAGLQQTWYVSRDRDEDGQPLLTIWHLRAAGHHYLRLRYNDCTEFVIDRPGSRIWAAWPDTATLADTATYLLGPILGFVLRLRGVVCLHASAVAVGAQAIAMLGPAGSGKSTTAAVLARLGYPVLSDDIVALTGRGDATLAQPAYPGLWLWPESVSALYDSPDALPRITPGWDKRYLDLTQNGFKFQPQPLPLAAIYILGERNPGSAGPFVEAVPAQAGLLSLVKNTYANLLLDKTQRAQEFELLSQVAASVPLRWVHPQPDPAHVSRIGEVILEDFQTLSSPISGMKSAKKSG
jgi:hypothetical protein